MTPDPREFARRAFEPTREPEPTRAPTDRVTAGGPRALHMRAPVLDLDDDPATAAALFERAAPDLETPTSVVLERGPPHDVARWVLRTAKGPWRMKVATDPAAKARLRWGAAVVSALLGRGLAVPRVERVRGDDGGARDEPLVVVETRTGTNDAATRWPGLSRAARERLVDPLARALLALHAVPVDALPRRESAAAAPDGGARPATPWRDALRAGVARRVARLRAQAVLGDDVLGRAEARLRSAVERVPASVERRPCHGRLRPACVALERDALAGLRDFEEARAADPWTDAALWMLSTGAPAGESALAFLGAFARDRPRPADLATRLDAYLGLETLRVASEAADLDAPEAVDALGPAIEAWLEGGWLPPS